MKLIRLIAITALKGRVEVLDDFGEVSASIPVELTSRTRREEVTADGELEPVPFQIAPGETIVPPDPANAGETRFVVEDVVN